MEKKQAIYKLSVFLLCILSLRLNAQQHCGMTAIESAQKDYTNGQFESLHAKLIPCLKEGFSRDEKIEALRLLAMSELAMDDYDEAAKHLRLLFLLYPSYRCKAVTDPPRYCAFVNMLQIPSRTIVTASKQNESLKEAPVPVSIISQEMIEYSAAGNLKELLSLYVPGMSGVEDHNELNIAMRGVYASSQQKILIMLNGHRLNCRAYSEANPDYSISLSKIKQIEILRGPASSLYGNVALTSVINIITKSGADVQGLEVSGGLGNNGLREFSLLYGSEPGPGHDILLWANIFESQGETIDINAENDHSPNPKTGTAILGGFKDKPSIDAGITYKSKDLYVLANHRYCKYIEPFSAGGSSGEVYNYGQYRTFLGTGPGLGSAFSHLELSTEKEIFPGFSLNGKMIADHNSIEVNMVIDPARESSGKVFWKEYSYGATLSAMQEYFINNTHKGNIILGFQNDNMKLYDSFFLTGSGGEIGQNADSAARPILDKGQENIVSAFLQAKHYFGKHLIFNLGGRYDYKRRHKGPPIDNFSPRLSVVYSITENTGLKLSYARSFVDAPYWYRYNSLPSYLGAENLLPEHLESYQLTCDIDLMSHKLSICANVFYNKLRDFIYRIPEASGDDIRYKNAGMLKLTGIEGEASLLLQKMKIHANICILSVLDSKDYGVTDDKIDNIPPLTANMLASYNILKRKKTNVIVSANLRYASQQSAPLNTHLNGNPYLSPDNTTPERLLADASTMILFKELIRLKITVSNLFNKKYEQGGSVNFPYPQKGRWYKISLSLKIKNV